MEGTYIAKIQTQMGNIEGKITLYQEKNILSGNIQAMGINSQFSNGTIEGNKVKFSGIIKSFLYNIRYEANGTIIDNKIKLTINSNNGTYELLGEKQ